MRKSNVAIALVIGVFLSGCSALNNMVKLAKDQKLEVTPSPLELHGNAVQFDISALLPSKMLPAKYVYTLNTFYKYGETDKAVGSIEFKASDFPNASSSASRLGKTFSFVYDDAMKQGTLDIQGVASDLKGRSKPTERITVAPGIITTSRLVKDVYYAAYSGHGYVDREELIPTSVDYYFDQGRSALKYSETKSEKGQGFAAFIASKNVTRTVTITGGHSPEGTETINSDLSQDRAQAIEKYYRGQMKRYDYKEMADDIKFVIKPVVQDWSAYKDALNGYMGISSSDKSDIIRVINGGGSFEDKEKALQKLSSYKKVFKDVYPGLRIAKTQVLTVKPKKTKAEISILAKSIAGGSASADDLTNEELMYAATLTPSLSEKEAIYKAATKKTGSAAAHNNLGAVYLEMAQESKMTANAEKAVTQFEIAAKKNNSTEVISNLATAYVMQGNSEKAYEAISQASRNGGIHATGIKGVKGALEIKKGAYKEAISSMGGGSESSDVLFNKGLALLLNKDYQNAISAFGNTVEKDSGYALAHYCSAIASARLKNSEDMIASLKSAVKIDPKLKKMALNDLEFQNFSGALSTALN